LWHRVICIAKAKTLPEVLLIGNERLELDTQEIKKETGVVCHQMTAGRARRD